MVSRSKQTILQSILDLIEKNPNFTLVKFEKTTHPTLEQLRRELKKNGAMFKVLKNTIFEKALNRLAVKNKELGALKEKIKPLRDNTAIVGFGEEWGRGLKAYFDFSQKEKTLTFKIGILDKEVYLANDLEKIAKLPAKDQLVAQLLSSLKSPIGKTVYAMKYNMNKLVYILSEKSKKGGEQQNG